MQVLRRLRLTAISCALLLWFIPSRASVVPKQVIPIWCKHILLKSLHLKHRVCSLQYDWYQGIS